MADDGDGDPEMFDISTLSEAEKRRLRRRQRILGNQGARLQRILNDDPSSSKGGTVETEGEDHHGSRESNKATVAELVPEGDDTIDGFGVRNREVRKNIAAEGSSRGSRDSPVESPVKPRSLSDNRAGPSLQSSLSLLKELSDVAISQSQRSSETNAGTTTTTNAEPKMGVQSDGTVIMPKMSEIYGRILICGLALFLSLLNAKRFLITFVSWEVAFYFMNGLPPMPPPNMAMVLAAVMGLHENQLSKIKRILHFGNCVLLDFSLFFAFTMVPHIVKNIW